MTKQAANLDCTMRMKLIRTGTFTLYFAARASTAPIWVLLPSAPANQGRAWGRGGAPRGLTWFDAAEWS